MEPSLIGIKAMRLSLRTLLAFEDNIFDQEQHRQLERLIPGHDAAAITLGRIRRVVRDPGLGTPGLVGECEELDPNIVAEYLDHQMAADVQERFEAFCLSSDKYLAEAASIHQVLSNVLGEPARTSRECRIRCYDLYGAAATIPAFEGTTRIFAENDPQRQTETPEETKPRSFDAFLRLFPAPSENSEDAEPVRTEEPTPPVSIPAEPVEEKPPSPWAAISRFFSSKNDRNDEETEKKPVSKDDEKRSSRGFPFWILLLLLLGTGLFFGWQTLNKEKPGEFSRTMTHAPAGHALERPMRKNENETIKAVLVPPQTVAPVENNLPEPKKRPEKPAEVVEKKSAPVSVTVTPPPVPTPKKEELPIVAVEESKKSAEKPTVKVPKQVPEVVEKKAAPMTVTPPPVPAPKKEGLPIIAVEEPKKPMMKVSEVAEKKSPPVAVTPSPVPLPKKEELPKIVAEEPKKKPEKPTVKIPDRISEVAEKKSSPVPSLPVVVTPKKGPVADLVAKLPSSPPSVFAAGESAKDPFLSAVTTESTSSEAVQPASWNTDWNTDWNAAGNTESVDRPEPQALPETSKGEPSVPKPQTPAKAVQKMREEKTSPSNEPMPFSAPTPNVLETSRMETSSIPKREPEISDRESIIAFQPISAPAQRRSREIDHAGEVKESPRRNNTHRGRENVQASWNSGPTPPRKMLRYEAYPAPEPSSASFGKVVHPTAMARQFGAGKPIAAVGEIRETSSRGVGRLLPQPEPGVVFSAPSAGEQWTLKTPPLELHPDQYLLSVTPYRIDLDLGGEFRIEMVGDAKLCLLAPDENGVPGIFVDYGRIVIRPNPSIGEETACSLRIRTEHVEGILRMKGAESLAFIDTFAEVLPENGTPVKTPKTSPILALIPATGQQMDWHPSGSPEPLATRQQASAPLKEGNTGFGAIRGMPNWIRRTPLPVEGRQLAEICTKIFQEHAGNCEAALHALILQDDLSVRFFGYRLWGDLGRFDVPLALLAETKPEEEPVRQSLVPYFREVMKRDEETIQRFADAIETVRR